MAPEKIYLYPDDRAGIEWDNEWGDKPWGEDCVEYTRTDAFIDKARTWLLENYDKYLIAIGSSMYFDYNNLSKDFCKAMEE